MPFCVSLLETSAPLHPQQSGPVLICIHQIRIRYCCVPKVTQPSQGRVAEVMCSLIIWSLTSPGQLHWNNGERAQTQANQVATKTENHQAMNKQILISKP